MHHAAPAAISITQATEWGTVYRPAEIAELAELARAHGLRLHMDGARLANAIARLGCSPAAATWRAGVEVLSLGATKNGALAAEAVLVFDPALAKGLAERRKRAGHLLSKMRFLSAQLVAMLEQGRWLRYAAQANAMAAGWPLASGAARAGAGAAGRGQRAVRGDARALDRRPARQGFAFHRWLAPPAGLALPVVRLVTASPRRGGCRRPAPGCRIDRRLADIDPASQVRAMAGYAAR